MKVLVKISGDLVKNHLVIEEIKKLSKTNDVTLIHGAGTQISTALKNKNIPYGFINGIRQTTEEGLKICFEESQKARKNLEKQLAGFDVTILSPCSCINGMISNVNAEEIFRDMHEDFDEKIIFTISDREKPFIEGLRGVKMVRVRAKSYKWQE